MIFQEQRLEFEFGKSWSVTKLDSNTFYREHMEKLDGTKAVDFVGTANNQDLYLIEVKDFRGHRIENKDRLQDGQLAIETGQKVRDSISRS